MRPNAPSRPKLKVAVIGAGVSGLAAIKSLQDEGIYPVCFEMGNKVGGLWTIENKNGRGGAYRSLHTNSSALKSGFSDFPMPAESGDFPSHEFVGRYLSDYAEKFELHSSIRFNTEVRTCTPMKAGYRLTAIDRSTDQSSEEDFDALIVANGHHWDPSFPSPLPTQGFTGQTMHSSEYVDPQEPIDLSGKRVLVVGIGNSAVDIASELSKRSDALSVCVSCRRGAWVIPKYLLGKPVDQGGWIPQFLPPKFRRRLVTRIFRVLVGSMSRFGLPEPDHLIGEAHPTLSDEFADLVRSGNIKVFPAIRDSTQRQITFTDGSKSEYDVIIYCTGYKVSFPFFAASHLPAKDNLLSLFHRVFHPVHRRLFFVGLAQPLGSVIPISEAQSRLIALHLRGKYNLPSSEKMLKATQEYEQKMASRFVPSPRHTMQIEPRSFHRALGGDLRHGVVRAERNLGIPFPLES